MKTLLILLSLPLILFSCRTYSEDDKKQFDQEIESYIKKNKIAGLTRTDSGLYFKILEPGQPEKIKFRDQVHFKYIGKLTDGTVFDDQMKEGQTFQVQELIAAWKEVMLELGEGGKAYLITPPHLGYGNYDLDKIPQNSILIFELEIIEII
jgi:FKBP-type peptidyl-prolyl cis-trans isomerase FkpA